MKIAALLASAGILIASGAFAQTPPPANVPPPPGINDPGVTATAPPAESRRAKSGAGDHQLALPAMRHGSGAGERRHMSLPEVSIHEKNGNSIQEYRRSGMLYMVVVTPKHGVQQIYKVDPQGRLVDKHGQKPVGPVMYKLLEWGKSQPAAADSHDAAQDAGGH